MVSGLIVLRKKIRLIKRVFFFFFNDTAPPEISTLSLHDALPICGHCYGAVYGADIPAPIWHDTMLGALAGVPPHDFHPPPGEYFRQGSGEDRVRVPDVRGMTPSQATETLSSAGFQVHLGPREPSTEFPKGTVTRTDPAPGASVDPGTTITLFVSKGTER